MAAGSFCSLARGGSGNELYQYRHAWHEEEVASGKICLLLPFGPTKKKTGSKVKANVESRKEEEQARKFEEGMEEYLLDDGGAGAQVLGIDGGASVKAMAWKPKLIDESKLKAGEVQDYSLHRRIFQLGKGTRVTPAGRFGPGLRCDGGTGMICRKILYGRPPGMVPGASDAATGTSFISLWVKVEKYPAKTACILQVVGAPTEAKMREYSGGGKVLLRPDGKVELQLRHPHGRPSWKSMAGGKDALAAFLATPPSSIVSKAPIPLDQWMKIRVFNDEPVVQGPNCFKAGLDINGVFQDAYLGPQGNHYFFNGRQEALIVLGNSLQSDQGFEGLIDSVLVAWDHVEYYPVDKMAWRDASGKRPVVLGKPYFFRDGAVFHASLDRGLEFDFQRLAGARVTYEIDDVDRQRLTAPGIRGRAWRLDPDAGFPRFPLTGMSPAEGTIEFWLRPVNFDSYTVVSVDRKTRKLTPPHAQLSGLRVYARGAAQPWLTLNLPRGRSGREPAIHPGSWHHVLLQWQGGEARAYLNGKPWPGSPRTVLAAGNAERVVALGYVELGIADAVLVKDNQPPQIEIDEVVAYNYCLSAREIAQAYVRWTKAAQPIPFYALKPSIRRTIGEMDVALTAMFPPGKTPRRARLAVLTPERALFFGPEEQPVEDNAANFQFARDGAIPQADYIAKVTITDQTGKPFAEGESIIDVTPPPMYAPDAGIVTTPPAPWTPIRFEGNTMATRMTQYALGSNGLPEQIVARGKGLLARPVRLLEDGQPMAGTPFVREKSTPVEAVWRSTFTGKTGVINARWHCDYDGCVKFTLVLAPQPGAARVAPVAIEFPLLAERATRFMRDFANATGMQTGVVPEDDEVFAESRDNAYAHARRTAVRKKQAAPERSTFKAHGFMNIMDLNDLDRGLYWFADTAIGWFQSPSVPAQTIAKLGDEVVITCNLVAEPAPPEQLDRRPIVFGILPHPARPPPLYLRTLDRIRYTEDKTYCRAYGDVFSTWPIEPRDNGFRVWPRLGRYENAEEARDARLLSGKFGRWVMYHSWFWMGFRGGGPDYWEMYANGHPSFTPDLVDHLCWEWNEWVRRGIYDGWYADEDYSSLMDNVRAGLAVRLPDGAVQRGEPFWGKREYTKRSRNISLQHGKKPMFLVHGTGSFNYSNIVFADSFLDGEGRGGMRPRGRGFVASTPLHRVETIQNAGLWGIVPAYYACIWETGKETSHHRWAWRMARECNSVLAHYECFVAFCETSNVFAKYWRDVINWGAADLDKAEFIPYWRAENYLQVEGMRREVLVSFYRSKAGILLLASNRTDKPREIRVKLDLKALGLGPNPSVRSHDSSYEPVEGTDFLSSEQVAKMKRQIEKEALTGALEDDGPDGLDLDEPSGSTPDPLRIENGSVLVLPTRPKDFRLVSIQ